MTELFLPEAVILNELRQQLPTMRMLDIGVGGGRTTAHFASRVQEYQGIDIDLPMIKHCRKLFADVAPNAAFNVCDAKSMGIFPDNAFDFILFSFNGIDYATHTDRLKILDEIHRVGRPGGLFCFSSHNVGWIKRSMSMDSKLTLRPIKLIKSLTKWFLRNQLNPNLRGDSLDLQDYVVYRDGPHSFKMKNYFIRPKAQVEQLAEHYYDILAYSNSTGQVVDPALEYSGPNDAWLYYLCKIR
jgi:ubiquinone/menaquinone biosynthesis C-methylase UbiE